MDFKASRIPPCGLDTARDDRIINGGVASSKGTGILPMIPPTALSGGRTARGAITAVSDDTLVFTGSPQDYINYWFAFRIRGVSGKTLKFFHQSSTAMAAGAHVSEDGGQTWIPPNSGIWREFRSIPYEGSICFTHQPEHQFHPLYEQLRNRR